MKSDFPDGEAKAAATNLLIGFFGVVGAFFLLPRTAKFMVRRFVLSTAGEVLAIVLTGLLTEKLVELLGRSDESDVIVRENRPESY